MQLEFGHLAKPRCAYSASRNGSSDTTNAALLIATPAATTTGAADSALPLLQLSFSPATTVTSSLVRSPAPAAPALTTLAPTAYAPAPTAATPALVPVALVRNFAPMLLIGCRNPGGYGRRAPLA